MSRIKVVNDVDVSNSYLVEGLPGIGLVAKIAADYMVDQLEMTLYAEVYSDDLPDVTIFESGTDHLSPAVKIYAAPEKNLLVLKSDAPVSTNSREFLESLTDWIEENNVTPIYQAGLPFDIDEEERYLFGVSTVNGALQEAGIELPPVQGGIGGPTGALLNVALEREMDAYCLIVESDPSFPDPAASRTLIENGVEPLTGIDIDTQVLEDSAGEIKKQKQELAERIQDMQMDRSSQAYPREMYR